MSEKVTGTQSIDRALDLLTRIVSAPTPMTLTELVGATGLAKGTTSRILSALERADMISRSPLGGFEPGTVLNNFAISGGAYNALVVAATPAMEELARLTHETINLAVASPSGLNTIAQVDGSYILGSHNWLDDFVPLHASASGKVLMAFGAGEPALNLVALTPHTITTREALERELALTRERGFGATRNELEIGLAAVAVPVRAHHGRVVAALSVTGPAARITRDEEPKLARAIVQVLGHLHTPTHEGAA